ncbi:MAG: twin-arginine translocase TatA/TatE family subunit [Syntrophaceticus schinkii]|jgi:TatA/E family protein of Tat protein translocase|nr:twin-arginine translocase TatA/TatE family subunit [Syntrophaceticus schinkii]MDD4260926.1 twin-arginine translocase TatA/TatE family subunit [Syntrophaceticus schinkii]MDD4675190.1 twin-arginine translocase TatA/TatE family subunit [Syntrophaceticus schinkii]
MFGILNIGPWELILILVVMLIVFGPGKLPEVAQSLGKAVREFRKASSNVQRVWDEVIKEEEPIKAAKSSQTGVDPSTDKEEENSSGDQSEGHEVGEETPDEDQQLAVEEAQDKEQVVDGEIPEDDTGADQE